MPRIRIGQQAVGGTLQQTITDRINAGKVVPILSGAVCTDLVLGEGLVLFYAQSGADKSSLINTRLIHQLQQAGYAVLPVGRASGALPEGLEHVDNIFVFNLLRSLDQAETAAATFDRMDARLSAAVMTRRCGSGLPPSMSCWPALSSSSSGPPPLYARRVRAFWFRGARPGALISIPMLEFKVHR